MAKEHSSFGFISGLALGGGLMYLLDPGRGNRRRALLRDKVVHASHVLRCAADKSMRDLGHRTQGVVAELRSAVTSGDASDDVLVQRVRARLGRACSHPNAIEVEAQDGRVVLRGPILAAEADLLLHETHKIRGIHEVEDRLERHKTPGDIPGLQGGAGRRLGQRPDLLQNRWAPATRLLVGFSAGTMLGDGMRRGGVAGLIEGALGAGLLARAITNLELRHLVGASEASGAVRMQKTINIHAPVEEVYKLCANPENFARFMAHVQQVRKTQDGRYHWTVSGPAGVSVSWDSEISDQQPNRLISWRTVPGSAVQNAGIMRFDSNSDGGTRVHILLSYNPPGGALGHVLASVFGSDPKAVMDEDLARMKSLLEVGKTRAHGERVTRDQIGA
ncbi:MAG: SRPBCC family protein [Terriglobales bacterium]